MVAQVKDTEARLDEHFRIKIDNISESFQEQVPPYSFVRLTRQLRHHAEQSRRERDMLTQKLAIYEEELHVADLRFRARGPREEDAAQIQELTHTLQERERRLAYDLIILFPKHYAT